MTEMTKHEYETWLNNSTTKKFIEYVSTQINQVNREINDGNFLLAPNSIKKIAYKVGYREAMEHLYYDILQQQEEESLDDLQEHNTAVWASRISEIKEG